MLNRRKQWLINPKFQLSFISFFISCSIINFILFYGVLNYRFWTFKQAMIAEGVSSNGTLVKLLDYQTYSLNIFLIGGAILGIVGMFLGGTWLSNKIAGPLYRIVILLNKKIEKPDNYDPINTRVGDYFGEVKDTLNSYIKSQEELSHKPKKDKAA